MRCVGAMIGLLIAGCSGPEHRSWSIGREPVGVTAGPDHDALAAAGDAEAEAEIVGEGVEDEHEVVEDEPEVVEPEPEVVEHDVEVSPCADDMRLVGSTCMDRWEAPNVEGQLPLVMYTFNDAAAWCAARDKRLCWDDEWLAACAGEGGLRYPYGDVRVPGRCNDDRTWRVYAQALLNGWPGASSSAAHGSLDAVMTDARARGASAAAAADHVMSLYQGTAAGDRPQCVGDAGVEDLVGNVEEWVRRRDGGDGPSFSGALVGRYWAEPRTCQSRVTVHGNAFRFYEIGFRCCRDLAP